jgi:hypothetical protein
MAKTRVGQMNEDSGRVEVRTVHGGGRTTEIPWTRGPQTRWERFKRAAVG